MREINRDEGRNSVIKPRFERNTFMANQGQHQDWILATSLRAATTAMAIGIVLVLILGITQPAPAQTYTVIHHFSGGGDGANPYAGLTMDAAGNLYGTTLNGGAGYGGVFKLKRSGSSFLLTPLYSFTGGNDGANPVARVVFGSNGTLYGTAHAGGTPNCENSQFTGCGLVFNLRPQPRACKTALCLWTESVLYSFTGASDGANPWGNVTFDQSGNLYGTTEFGGIPNCSGGIGAGCGTVFKLAPSGGGWTETVLYSFTNGSDGSRPYAAVTFDTSGNLYGTNSQGAATGCLNGRGCGTVFQLTPAGSGWMEKTIYAFQGGSDGGNPVAGVIFDQSGNLYGAALSYGSGGGGTVVELSPLNGNWIFNLLFSLSGVTDRGPEASLVMDQAGNLYGTTNAGGAHGYGSVFKLTPSGGTWMYTSLYDFMGGSDGGNPISTVVFDANGNLYGTATVGGTTGHGVVWEITP
jgi:uncharacterized repeat protein (TIGR03803 family)